MNDTALLDLLQREGIHERDAALLVIAAKQNGGIGAVIGALIQHGDNRTWLKELVGK